MSDDNDDFGILKKHKNMLLASIKSAGLNPQDFLVRETAIQGFSGFTMKYRDTPLWFSVKRSKNNYGWGSFNQVEFKPGLPRTKSVEMSWDNIDEAFQIWLDTDLKEYIGEVTGTDLWAQIQSQTPVVSDEPVGSDDREPFTQPEQVQLRMAIKEFRQVIIEKHAPNDEQQKLIDNRLEYLSEQLPQLNRINWRSVALTTLIAIVIQLTLSTEQGKVLFEMGQRIFSNIVPLLPE